MTPREALETILDAEHAEAVIAHRRAMRKPLTAHAAQLLADQFRKCANPNEAADQMILMGWQGFRAEWMAPRGPNVVSLPTRESSWDRQGREYSDVIKRLGTG